MEKLQNKILNKNLDGFEIKCGSCDELVDSVKKPENTVLYSILSIIVFGSFGFYLGTMLGIATMGVGIAATPITTIIGVVIGYKFGKWVAYKSDKYSCPECGSKLGNLNINTLI